MTQPIQTDMAGNEQTQDVRVHPPADLGFVSRYLEYILVALLAIVVAIGLAAWARGQHSSSTDGAAATSDATSAAKPCAASGFGPASRKEGTCSTRGAQLTFVNGHKPLVLPGVAVQLDSAVVLTATSPSGRARDRSRVVVRVHFTNKSKSPLTPGPDPVYLVVGRAKVDPDPVAERRPGGLDTRSPLAPGATRSGLLHFELADGQTTAFTKSGGQLGIRLAGATGGKQAVGVIRFSATSVKPAPAGG